MFVSLRRTRTALNVVALNLLLTAAQRIQGSGEQAVLALSISRNEHRIIRVELGERVRIFSGRVHKRDGNHVSLTPSQVRHLEIQIADFRASGGEVFVKGYPDRAWGLDLPAGPGLARVEASIFGARPSRTDACAFSYVLDRNGLYFDGRVVTDFERILDQTEPGFWRNDPDLRAYFSDIDQRSVRKYAEFQERVDFEPPEDAVLIVGQVSGDAATQETWSIAKSNLQLVEFAKDQFPCEPLYYKPHPHENSPEDEFKFANIYGCRLVPRDVSFDELSGKFRRMIVITSGAGLEAALRGVEVHTLGVSFYSHRGFTVDHFHLDVRERRTNALSPIDVYASFLVSYARYAQQHTEQPNTYGKSDFLTFVDSLPSSDRR